MSATIHRLTPPSEPVLFPPGLVGEVASFIYGAAPRPNSTIALAGAIGFLAGICGRSFNVSDTGLNQYVLVLAPTGTGKEAVADGIARLMTAIQKTVPAAREFRGPGELVSAPGLFKWLAKMSNPVVFSIIGEFGLMLKLMTMPKASPNMAGLHRVLLQIYSKSGQGKVFDAAAYSDPDNRVPPIDAPALTLVGEGVPDSFYAALDESMIASGLLPRFLIFETREPRPYDNEYRHIEPAPQLVERLAFITTHVLELAKRGEVCAVSFTPDARAKFAEFDRLTTDEHNKCGSETTRHLWNRAHLKAMKLAALIAVGENPYTPVISIDDCMWATTLVHRQITELIAKFETGETGDDAGDEVKQQTAILRCVYEYLTQPYERFSKSGATPEMHRDHVIPQSYLSRRLLNLPTFKQDPRGATPALRRALQNLLEDYELVELGNDDKVKKYRTKARAFMVANPDRFIEAGRMKYGTGV